MRVDFNSKSQTNMKVVILTTDNREPHRNYNLDAPYFGTAPEALLQGLAMLPEVEVHVISCAQRPMRSPVKLAANIWFHSLHVPKIGWLRTGYQGCIRAVRKKLQEIKPDIVHGQGTERDCAISAVFSGYPNILTLHGNIRLIAKLRRVIPFSFYWLTSLLEGYAVPRADGVICISNYTKQAIESEVLKTWVVPNAVHLSFLRLGKVRLKRPERKLLYLRNSSPVILVVGTIDERKNQNDFIRALVPIAVQLSFKVRFFGSCGNTGYAKEFLELVASKDWCYYGGMLSRDELRNEFNKATMLALPTLEDNCPMVVLEAMASGVPVLASRVGGVPDLINGSSTGLFCDPNNPDSFREGVIRLLGNQKLSDRIASLAQNVAESRFHPRVIAKRHLEIYQELLRTFS